MAHTSEKLGCSSVGGVSNIQEALGSAFSVAHGQEAWSSSTREAEAERPDAPGRHQLQNGD